MHFKHRSIAVVLALLILVLPSSAQPEGWPELTVPTSEGALFSSSSLEGKITVVTIWASWCSSCRRQLPILSRLQDQYREENVQVVGFSFDRTEEEHAAYLEHFELNFPAIFARRGSGLELVKKIQDRAGPLQAVPTLLIYDQNGSLVFRAVGFFHMSKLEKLIGPLLTP